MALWCFQFLWSTQYSATLLRILLVICLFTFQTTMILLNPNNFLEHRHCHEKLILLVDRKLSLDPIAWGVILNI